MTTDTTTQLAQFAASLKFTDIPAPVLRRAEDLFLDWFASALAGKGARPVESITRFMRRMGPDSGPSQILIDRSSSSPLVLKSRRPTATQRPAEMRGIDVKTLGRCSGSLRETISPSGL